MPGGCLVIKHFAVLFFLLGVGTPGATTVQSAALSTAAVDPRLEQADKLFAERADLAKVKLAAESLRGVLKDDSQNFEAARRLCEFYYFLGKRVPPPQQLEFFQRGMEAAKKAIELQPHQAAGYFWLATHQGLYGETKGLFSSMRMRKEIRAHFEKSAQLDPNYYGGGAWRGLGRWDYRVPRLMGGNKKRSAEELEKSLQIAPGNSLTKLYLAETYLEIGRKPAAQQQLREILTMQPDARWTVEHRENIVEAQRLLAKHFKKVVRHDSQRER